MVSWVRRVLTRRYVRKKGMGRPVRFEVEPRDELVYGVQFAIGMTTCLSGIEIASIAFLHTWNSQVFTAISGLIGLVTGIIVGQRA